MTCTLATSQYVEERGDFGVRQAQVAIKERAKVRATEERENDR